MLKGMLAAALVPALAAAGYYLVQDYRATQASAAYRRAVMEQAHTEYQARKQRDGKTGIDGSLDELSVGATVHSPSQ